VAANDGHLTLLEDGTLQVQYPSHGIREYWRHSDGRGAQILQEARMQFSAGSAKNSNKSISKDARDNGDLATKCQKRERAIQLVFRRFGDSVGAKKAGVLWHWGLSIDGSIYEVNGAMAVMGPNGIVAASSPLTKNIRTKLSQFHGFLDMPQTTNQTDEDIEEFSRRWVKRHPVYVALGPNCQTYAEDLFAFLTGEGLPFAKASDRMVGPGGSTALKGPEASPSAVWLDRSKKPE